MLEFKGVGLSFGSRLLLQDVDFSIHAGHKVGVVGRNGVGKTTLFDLILRRRDPSAGRILQPKNWRVAWLDQHIEPSDRRALDFAIDGDRRLRSIEKRIKAAERQADNSELGGLYADFEDVGGYRADARAGTILSGLGFSREDFEKPHREFSGGWRIRLNLARTLMTPSDLLLLDEPTNHLDFETTVWLEKWIRDYPGTLLTIAHDREFLNRVVQEIVHIEHETILHYRGDFDSFERERANALTVQQAQFEKQEMERQRLQRFVDRFRYKSTKAKQVQSRVKVLAKMSALAPLRAQSPYTFEFKAPSRLEQPMVAMDNLRVGYSEEDVIKECSHSIYPGDRIGILGLNGSGKSTLLKTLAGELDPHGGSLQFARHCEVGYFSQHQLEVLDAERTVVQHLEAIESLSTRTAYDYLGSWGFRGHDIERAVGEFSGGEKARLVLALLCRRRPSLLLLDEPTNHLDLEMRDALAAALQEFQGAFLLVAHDRQVLQQCVDELWMVKDGRVSRFLESIDAYSEMLERSQVEPEPKSRDVTSRRGRRQSRAKQRADTAALRSARRELQRRLEELHSEKHALSLKLADKDLLASATGAELQEWLQRHGELARVESELETQWLEVEDALSES